jgi:hypothetical protein
MQYRGAELTAEDIETLQVNGFPRAAFYLGVKAAESSVERQGTMLKKLASLGFDYQALSVEDIRVGTALMGVDNTVAGEKLGQYSRHGLSYDIHSFDVALQHALADKPTAPLYMVANYPYIALDVLASHSLKKGNSLGVINPDRLGQTELPVGLLMEGDGSALRVEAFMHDYVLPEGSVIFDDVIREGTTRDAVLAWAGGTAVSPTFVAAGRVGTSPV